MSGQQLHDMGMFAQMITLEALLFAFLKAYTIVTMVDLWSRQQCMPGFINVYQKHFLTPNSSIWRLEMKVFHPKPHL